MSINSIPVDAENNFRLKNTTNVDVSLEKNKDDQNNSLIENKNISTEKLRQEVDETLTVAEKIAESNEKKATSSEDVDKALDIVTSFIHSTSKQVDFSSDNKAGKTVITVTDKETQEVINQFPSDKIISMAEKIQALHQEVESISGLLIDSHV